jgi:hypothetical protein
MPSAYVKTWYLLHQRRATVVRPGVLTPNRARSAGGGHYRTTWCCAWRKQSWSRVCPRPPLFASAARRRLHIYYICVCNYSPHLRSGVDLQANIAVSYGLAGTQLCGYGGLQKWLGLGAARWSDGGSRRSRAVSAPFQPRCAPAALFVHIITAITIRQAFAKQITGLPRSRHARDRYYSGIPEYTAVGRTYIHRQQATG